MPAEREIIIGGAAFLKIIRQMMLRQEITVEQFAESELRFKNMSKEQQENVICIY
jgi:exopolysaccharide biosynthesis predicted pyruvyltransferase EpsI